MEKNLDRCGDDGQVCPLATMLAIQSGMNGVTATAHDTSHSPVDIFYGPSSCFSFLEQIHHDLGSLTSRRSFPNNAREIQDGSTAIADYKFSRLYFPPEEKPMSMNSGFLAIASVPTEQAQQCLQAFVLTYHHNTPFLSHEDISAVLEEAQGDHTEVNFSRHRIDSVLLALALGAFVLGYSDLKTSLVEEAQKSLAMDDEVINLDSVQALLMMISRKEFPALCNSD